MPSEHEINVLNARIAHLEENRRYIHNALEMVLSLEDFYTEIGGDNYSLDTLLPEAKRRIDAIFPFDVMAFYVVDESDLSFKPAFRHPQKLAGMIQQEVDYMIDGGYFAWAIRERRGVVISSKDHSRQYLLHVIANHNHVQGMFGGLLPADHTSLPDTAMTLLSIILLNVANAAESMDYTNLLKNQSLLLERQVAQRTKALTLSQEELEQAMDRANALAETAQAASRAKGDFLAKMSHELRTPLNGIIGMTEVALSTPLDDNQRRIIEIIGQESFSLLQQINDVLDFSKIESGKLEMEEIGFDLRSLLEEVGEGFVFQTSEKGVALNVFIHPSVPTELMGDPVRIRQILLNLTGNAVKFTHKGEILIEARQEEKKEDAVIIHFSITDTGIGIEPEKVDRVFSSFTQADDSTTRQYGGTGLGTTISKQLVELMGGQIGLDSRPGKGSTFWFTIALKIQAGETSASNHHDAGLEKGTVLVVDDSATICRIMATYLAHLGMSAVTTANGEMALGRLAEKSDQSSVIDVIITGDRMPDMSGIELKDHARRLPGYKNTPVIVVTSLKEAVSGRDFTSHGFDGCLSKPIKLDDLKDVLARVTGVVPAETKDKKNPVTKAVSGAESCQVQPQSGHILVVDDYPTNRQVVLMHLTAVGFTVDLAENGRQAVQAFNRNTYDLILMDIQMPVLNGYDATRRIRKLEADRNGTSGSTRRMPIIALTANAMKGDEDKCLEAGMDGYLIKPIHRYQLNKTVTHWIGLRDRSKHIKSSTKPDSRPAGSRTIDGAIMDIATAVDEFGDAETVKIVADQLIENVENQLCVIRDSIASENLEQIRKEAHAIKGGAATMEAIALSASAACLEEIAPNGSIEDIRTAFGGLEKQFYRFAKFVSQQLQPDRKEPDHADITD